MEGGGGEGSWWGQSFSLVLGLEVDSGDGCTTVSVYLMPLSCVLKNSYNGKSHVYFTANLKTIKLRLCLLYPLFSPPYLSKNVASLFASLQTTALLVPCERAGVGCRGEGRGSERGRAEWGAFAVTSGTHLHPAQPSRAGDAPRP